LGSGDGVLRWHATGIIIIPSKTTNERTDLTVMIASMKIHDQ
jgi:diketogulonate reductase-like aldo/keto reductase